MRLTRFTDYALRVLIYAALNEGRQITITELTEKYNLSRNHLLKVVHLLSKEGLLLSKRGRNGGLVMGKAADKITVGYVVSRFEPQKSLVDCINPRCVLVVGCVLKRALDEAHEVFIDRLNQYTIADLIKEKNYMLLQFGLDINTENH
ncbi:MAG: Rrf2 family transcriptional regulator [Gammaproteobacteria bacterium]|nr:Rrf2 family transcriptional regulator [Gammaproteobacteria bacterium]